MISTWESGLKGCIAFASLVRHSVGKGWVQTDRFSWNT